MVDAASPALADKKGSARMKIDAALRHRDIAEAIRSPQRTGARAGPVAKHVQPSKGHILVEDLSVEFHHKGISRLAVQNANLDIAAGEFVCLLGPTGCGKSTLLNCVAGFERPTRGRVVLDGTAVMAPGPERGMVFQQHSLFSWKTVKQNIAFGPKMAGVKAAEAEARAQSFLAMVGLSGHENHYPDTLSGGMQQRVGIARALANYPSVLLMDEPFAALDAQTRTIMQESLLELWSTFRNTVLFITHDVDEAVFLADRIVVMSASPGRLIADIPIPLARPRDASIMTTSGFLDIKRRCLDLIRAETLKAFGQAS
jgi:NitT/TauT family transport system ATP-binding protein